MPDILEIIAELLRLSEAATPGPWETGDQRKDIWTDAGQAVVEVSDPSAPSKMIYKVILTGNRNFTEEANANIALVIFLRLHAPALALALRELLAKVRELAAANAAWGQALKVANDCPSDVCDTCDITSDCQMFIEEAESARRQFAALLAVIAAGKE